jgi:hypothetical protein
LSFVVTKPNPRVGGISEVSSSDGDGDVFVIAVTVASEAKAGADTPARTVAKAAPNAQVTARPIGGPS